MGMGRAISVVIADDEPHVVDYLEILLHAEGFDVAGVARDADSAVELAHRMRPDVVLLDLRMPGGGLSAAQLIGSVSPDTRIVVFSADADEVDVLPLLRSGIDGYVVKGASSEQLADAIRSAVAGGKFLAPEIGRFAIQALTTRLHDEERGELRDKRVRDRITGMIAATDFTVVYQPVVHLGTGETEAVEALTRFTGSPSRPPDEWFGEADGCGLRVSLELATAGAALRDLAEIHDHLALCVNVSPATALSGRLAEILTGAELERVILEVTEHSQVTDYAALNAALAPWRERGVRVAVDDAGGGYASFAHVLSLTPELIKLDISLTADIHADPRRQALARALIGFAAEMDVIVVAEGIETAAQLDVLAGLGAHYAQGFHLGRPRPLAEQEALLERDVDLRDGARPAPADVPVSRAGALRRGR